MGFFFWYSTIKQIYTSIISRVTGSEVQMRRFNQAFMFPTGAIIAFTARFRNMFIPASTITDYSSQHILHELLASFSRHQILFFLYNLTYQLVILIRIIQQYNHIARIMKKRQRYQPESTKKQSLLQIQKQLLVKLLSSNEGSTSWKILVFDSYNRGIVSSQLKMKDLRDQNITLYLSITEERQQIHGVTVVYFVQPTIQNINIISNDLLQDMYTSVYIHFSSQPSPQLLSHLAKDLSNSKKNSVISRIAKIEYSCVGYNSIDHSMCILPTELEIWNFLTAMNYQPIFIYNPSNEQSKALVQKLKSKYTSVSNSFANQNKLASNSNNINYAIFYIFNRQTDYFPMLSHGITYASLLQNIYKINKNGSKLAKNKQNVELSLQDEIWLNKKNYLISEMKLGQLSNELSSKMIGLSTEEYTENNQKFKKVQWHLNNAGEMISEAKKRRLNQFYDAQLQIYNKSIISKELKRDILILLKQGTNSEDKLRLMLIYLMFDDNIDELKQFEEAYPEAVKNNKYVELKQKKMKGTIVESASNKYIKKFAKGIWKNLMAGDKKFRITKQLEKIKSTDFTELTEGGLAVQGISSLPANIKIVRNVVYCLGGVCFHEYANIMEFDSDVIYSGDQLISYREVI